MFLLPPALILRETVQSISMKKAFILVLLIFGLISLSILTYRTLGRELISENSVSPTKKLTTKLNREANHEQMNSSPVPFEEMTIPYLRSREYQSQLGDRSLFQDTSAFSSYVTSYQSDGLQVNGLLYVPKGNMPNEGWPAVVFIHGYIPPAEYSTTNNYNSYAAELAEQGLVVFKIDLRGHGNSEGVASGAYYSGDYVIDTLNAVSALESLSEVNEQKIGLWGHSMAGNIVFRSMTAQPSIHAAVIWAGAVYTYEDFQSIGISDSSYQRPEEGSERSQERSRLQYLYGNFDPADTFWRQVPATNYLEGVDTPLQIHHATNDSVVRIEYARNIDAILDDSQVPHHLYEYSSGGHNITGSSFTTAMQRSGAFLKNPQSEL